LDTYRNEEGLFRPSENQHRVAVAEEAVFVRDGFGVDLLEPGEAFRRPRREERGDEAEERGPWEVEIGEQVLTTPDGVTGPDEE